MSEKNEDEKDKKVDTKEGGEMISMPKEDYNEIIGTAKLFKQGYDSLKSEIEELRKGQRDSSLPAVMKKITDRIVTLRVYNGDVVTGYVNKSNRPDGRRFVYQEQDPTNPREKIDFIDIILSKSEEPVKVQYLDFLNTTDKVACKVVGEKKEEKEANYGVTEKIVFSGETRKQTGIIVPLEVTWVERVFTLKLPDDLGGKEVKVNELFVNA